MELWGSVSMRGGMLVFGFLALLQPAEAAVAADQPASRASISHSALKGIELAGLHMAGQDAPSKRDAEKSHPAVRGIGLAAFAVAAQSSLLFGDTKPSDNELECLARGIYFEARGESVRGQLAVGRVIMNRVASEAYPNTICGVVYQNAHWHNRCQFSFACDGEPDVITERTVWNDIQGYAAWLLANDDRPGVQSELLVSLAASTHYHADYVSPDWAKRLTLTGRIGRHYFYYDPSA